MAELEAVNCKFIYGVIFLSFYGGWGVDGFILVKLQA